MHSNAEHLSEHIPAALRSCFAAQRAAFAQQHNPSLQQRRGGLRALHRLLVENRDALVAAVNQDFGCRSRFETMMTELLQGQEAALDASKQLPRWIKKQRRSLDITQYPLARAYVVPQPPGVVGIVVPWSFPIGMAVQSMIRSYRNLDEVLQQGWLRTLSFLQPPYSGLPSKIVDIMFWRNS